MAYPNNKRGALLALALSGGVWAWQNRDKISGWMNRQRIQMQPTPGAGQPTMGGSYTGSTHRIDEPDVQREPKFPAPNEGNSTQI